MLFNIRLDRLTGGLTLLCLFAMAIAGSAGARFGC